MTETEWLACRDPNRLLEAVRGRSILRELRVDSVWGERVGAVMNDDRLSDAERSEALEAVGLDQCRLLRCLFRNPFRFPARLRPSVLAWHDGLVGALAQAIYDERTFDRLPVLADALEEGGCTDDSILSHCRSPDPHVRECWVVALLLGKS